MKYGIAIALALLFSISCARAGDLAVYGSGNMTCSGWTFAREERTPDGFDATMLLSVENWIFGYVSAANVYDLHFPSGYEVGRETYLEIDGYCRTHPDDKISVATKALVAHLRNGKTD